MDTTAKIYDVFDAHRLRGYFEFEDSIGRMSKARKRNILKKLVPILVAAKLQGEDYFLLRRLSRVIDEHRIE